MIQFVGFVLSFHLPTSYYKCSSRSEHTHAHAHPQPLVHLSIWTGSLKEHLCIDNELFRSSAIGWLNFVSSLLALPTLLLEQGDNVSSPMCSRAGLEELMGLRDYQLSAVQNEWTEQWNVSCTVEWLHHNPQTKKTWVSVLFSSLSGCAESLENYMWAVIVGNCI